MLLRVVRDRRQALGARPTACRLEELMRPSCLLSMACVLCILSAAVRVEFYRDRMQVRASDLCRATEIETVVDLSVVSAACLLVRV